jgi:uncharacterized protein YbjT (DUF2867 family)/glyoxylase-like metal-dependent hydrolase (beta-lactamase superfamily II)
MSSSAKWRAILIFSVVAHLATPLVSADEARARALLREAAQALRLEALLRKPGIAIEARGTRDLAARRQGMRHDPVENVPLATRLALDLRSESVAFETEGRVNSDAEEHLRYVFRLDRETLLVDRVNSRAFHIGRDTARQAARYRSTVPHLLLGALLDPQSPERAIGLCADPARSTRDLDVIEAQRADGATLLLGFERATRYLRMVEIVVDLPVDGRVPLAWSYDTYREVDGVPFPTGHRVSIDGRDFERLKYREVAFRAPAAHELAPPPWIATPAPRPSAPPASASTAAPPPATAPPPASPPAVSAEAASPLREIRPGVHFFRNARGGFHPLVVAQSDGLLVVDAPAAWHELAELPPSRSDGDGDSSSVGRSMLAELATLLPGQPVRRLVLTHHHGDHIGGALPFIDAGVEIIATRETRAALALLAGKHGRALDAARVRLASGRIRLEDSTRPVDLVDVGPNPHSEGMLVVYLPNERLLYQSDLFEPLSAANFPARERLPVMRWFGAWLERSGLNVEEVLAIHGSGRVTSAQLAAVRGEVGTAMRVAVVGATGTQGGAVARELLSRGIRVRALTRDPDGVRARALAEAGAEVVQASLDDVATLRAAFTGAHAVFAMTDFWEHGFEREIAHGRNIVAAARAVNSRHLIFSSVASAHRATGLPHFESKHEIERAIRESGLPFTVFRPASFMENWSGARTEFATGWLVDPQKPTSRQQLVSVRDLARFVADAVERPEEWIGRSVDLAGDELTIAEMAAVASRVFGSQVRHRRISWREAERAQGAEMIAMLRWFERSGYDVDVPALRAAYPWMMRFEEFLAQLPGSRDGPEQSGATAQAVGSLIDRVAAATRWPGAAAAPVLQLEWRGETGHPFDSHRPAPPWDSGRAWQGWLVDLPRGIAFSKQVEIANGARSIGATQVGPDRGGIAFSASSGALRRLDSASIDAALEERAPYSPLLALAALERHPDRVRLGADRTCRGQRLRTLTYERGDGRRLHFLVDPATHRMTCVDHDYVDYDGSVVPLRVEHDARAHSNAGPAHPRGFAEYAHGALVRRMELAYVEAGKQSLQIEAPSAGWKPVGAEAADLRRFQVLDLAPGVWLVGEGVMYQLFVEMDRFLIAIDAVSGNVEARLRAITERVPDKPVRYLLVTHPHADHLHGAHAFARRGATILAARSHVEAVRAHLGERFASQIEPVDELRRFESGDRRLDIVDLGPTPHSAHLLGAYLHAERLLFQSDLMVVSRWDPTPPASGNMLALDAAIRRLKLDVERIVSPHTPVLSSRQQLADAVRLASDRLVSLRLPYDERWRTDPAASW